MEYARKLGEDNLEHSETPKHFQELNVTYHKLKIKNKPHDISLIGDTHYANSQCIDDFLEYSINRIKRSRTASMIGMGDFAEFNDKSSPGYAIHQQRYSNEDSKDYIEELLYPIRNKIWTIHDGNHDGTRSRKKVGTSQTRDIARYLDTPYSRISCYHVIDFNDHRLILYTNHGKKRGTVKMVGTRRKTWHEQLMYKLTDILAIGHFHRLIYEDINPVEEITENVVIDWENMKMKTIPAQFPKRLITGSFLEYLEGYGQEEGYAPTPPGYPILRLYRDGTYDVELIWEREWRNNLKV